MKLNDFVNDTLSFVDELHFHKRKRKTVVMPVDFNRDHHPEVFEIAFELQSQTGCQGTLK